VVGVRGTLAQQPLNLNNQPKEYTGRNFSHNSQRSQILVLSLLLPRSSTFARGRAMIKAATQQLPQCKKATKVDYLGAYPLVQQ